MLGATHACANPLTAHYGIAHGIAIALMLPHVIRFNRPTVEELYVELAGFAGLDSTESLAGKVEYFRQDARLPGKLSDCGVRREELRSLAGEAAKQWTAGFNPQPVSEQDLFELYERAF